MEKKSEGTRDRIDHNTKSSRELGLDRLPSIPSIPSSLP